jgi:IclR family transcriptional regulator, acetate operon repressor
MPTMTLPLTTSNCVDNKPNVAMGVLSQRTRRALSAPGETASARAGRGVLDGAFAVLDALAHSHTGLGLTDLARASGLAKTSAHRLAEQLVVLGAVQCVAQRYYIGARMGHLGQRWQPDPLLRRAGQALVRDLAKHLRAIASLRIIHDDALRVICTTVPCGHGYMPTPIDSKSTAQTATGRVLYAADRDTEIALLPDCWTPREWRRLRESISEPYATVIDHQEAFAGICCASAPVWWPNGTCAGALTALVQSTKCPPCLPDLVSRTARRITTTLQQLTETSVCRPPRPQMQALIRSTS